MIEINTPQIDIERIKACIEQEIQQHKKAGLEIAFKSVPTADFAEPVEDLNSILTTKDDFLQFHGQDFINTVYTSILHREPDPQGGKIYFEKLKNGELTKVDIMGRLRYSSEGRKKKVLIKGLLFAFILQTLFKVPVLGWGLRVVAGVLNLPTILKNIQKIESDAIAQNRFMEEKTETVLSHVIELRNVIDNLKTEILQTRAAQKIEIQAEFAGVSMEISSIKTELSEHKTELSNHKTELSEHKTELSKRIKDHEVTFLDVQRRVQILLEEAREKLSGPISNEALVNMVKEEDHIFDAMYLNFEDRFRGTQSDIKGRVSVYLPYVQKTQKTLETTNTGIFLPLLDVGCGRGEWLELLKDNNIAATGLDLNRVMVDKCQDADLDVIQSDCIAYLRSRKNNSLSVVTGFHIVEHLPFKTMIALFDESFRVLKPGGIVIFETPNPENIMVGACDFYTDPTHKNPIPPRTLAYLIEARGFVNAETLRLHPNDSIHIEDQFLNQQFTMGQDYSVIGQKP